MKIAVLKFGGHALKENNSLNILIENIKYLQKYNYKIVIVHGGTPTVEDKLKELNIDSKFINGYRVTTKKIMDVVQYSICGEEVINIVKALNKRELNALSLNGSDCNLIKCKKKESNIDYGYVGDVININRNLIMSLIDRDIIPVISPIGIDDHGNSYNLNSDFLASAIAKKIKANHLFMITNINGIYEDINNKDSRLKVIDKDEINNLIDKNMIKPEMATKVNACLDYISKFNNTAYIIDNKTKINNKLFSSLDKGTKIINNNAEYNIRLATNSDIKDILKLMHLSFIKYQENIDYKVDPMKEKYEDILKDIYNRFVFVITYDNKIVGSARLSINNNLGRLSRIAIDPNYQNKGFGSILLKYLENYAFNLGISTLGLTTLDKVDYLSHFYSKNNYVNILTNNSRGYTRALMIKNLENNINNLDLNYFIN